MNKTLLKTLLIVFLLFDTAYSFYQYYHTPLDGDMAPVVLPQPGKGYYEVLQDPFGTRALLHHQVYANPNRFFAHWTMSAYFKTVPLVLQKVVSPVTSVFLASAIAKIMVQLMILFLISAYCSNTRKINDLWFLSAAVLIAPMFQASGYQGYMGIIDQSVTYVFFYALPLTLLLLFFLPFYNFIENGNKLSHSLALKILLFLLMIILALSGPLIPGIVLVVCPMALAVLWLKNFRSDKTGSIVKRAVRSAKQIPSFVSFYFIVFCLFSLYSLYIGTFNYLDTGDKIIPILERYARLPMGILNQFTRKLAFPLLFGVIALNYFLIRIRYPHGDGKKIRSLIRLALLFTCLYIFLLPLGGFRVYRENILRYDTIMPVTVAVIMVYAATSLFLIRNLKGKIRTGYIALIVCVIVIFTNADRPETSGYECQERALEALASNQEKLVRLECDCPVLTWATVSDYRKTNMSSDLLYYWNITKERKFYYQVKVTH